VQGGHAALESARKFKEDNHPSLVYLRVKNEAKLRKVIRELIDNEIDFVVWRDDIFSDEITAVATQPLHGDKRKLLRRYSLL